MTRPRRNTITMYQRLLRPAFSSTPLYHVVINGSSNYSLLFEKLLYSLAKANNANNTLKL